MTLQAAAQAVLDRWDSPQWKWAEHGPTADLMHALREALAAQPTLRMSGVAQRKASNLFAQGYELAGYVLEKEGARSAILWDAAVRWVTPPERHRLMHVEVSLTAAQPCDAKPAGWGVTYDGMTIGRTMDRHDAEQEAKTVRGTARAVPVFIGCAA